jgi:hypothetical protein
MRIRTVIGTLLGLMTMLSAWALTQAQEADSPEPPKAAAPEPKGEERAGKADEEMLGELQDRKEKALRDLQLLEAQLAVKQAEVQKAEADIRVFSVQHPDLVNRGIMVEKLRRDPEVADLMAQIRLAQERLDSVTRRLRIPSDPTRVHMERNIQSLKGKLQKLVESKGIMMKSSLAIVPSSLEPRPAGGSGEVERKLDILIGELESLKRALSREAEKP